ncbi:PQQ-binding-like beta-propeller repeat protein [Rosettibacter firmus]|uniref:outer membrane protein assembly factor BamB family protein n=1 Tax=Rosettibacter firmus TaxID=3111522 RepID=UPI00336BCEB6
MKKIFRLKKIFILGLLLTFSCTQDLIIKNYFPVEQGIEMFGKVPQRDFYEDAEITDSLQLLWEAQTNGSHSNTSLIVNKKFVFIGDLSGRIYGFDTYSGKSFGYYKYSGEIPVAPIINKLRIYFIVNVKKEKYSLFIMKDLTDGKTISEEKINGSISNEMLKLNDGIIVITDNGEVLKFNFGGEKIWQCDTKVTTHSSPASNGEIIVFGNDRGILFFVSATNGKILHRQKISDYIIGNITIDNKYIYFSDYSGTLYNFDMVNKKIVWKFNTKTKITSVPVFNNENIFVGNLSGKIYSIKKVDGKLNWSINTNGIINTTPLLLKNFLIQPDYNRKIYFINPFDGRILKTINYEARLKLTPVYFDGILFFGIDRRILAYKTFNKN